MVKVNQSNDIGMDEIYCAFYECPNCKDGYIIQRFKFCPNCGEKIIWVDNDGDELHPNRGWGESNKQEN